MPFKAEEPAASALGLFPKGAGAKPKEGEAQPSEFFKLGAGMSCALSKIPPAGPAAPRRLGMRQFFTKAAEWKALAGEAFPGCGECGPEAKRPKMKAWPSLPGRPGPGPEPRLRPLGKDEDVSAAMAKLSQLRKEWEASRQGLKACEGAEAGAFAAMERAFPIQPKQISGKRGCFPMGMATLEAWGLIKEAALVESKIGSEAINIR